MLHDRRDFGLWANWDSLTRSLQQSAIPGRERALLEIAGVEESDSMNPRVKPILLLTFVNAIGGTILIPVLPFVVRDLGQSDVVYALLIAAYPAAQFFAAPVLGSLADHFGRRPVLIASQAGTLASWMLFGAAWFFDSSAVVLALIAASRIVDGLTGGNASVAAAYLADVTVEDERSRVFGAQGAITGAALLLGPVIGSLSAASSIGFLGSALIAGIISAIALVWMTLTLTESLAPENRVSELDLNAFHQLNLIAKASRLTNRTQLLGLFSTQAFFTLAFSSYATLAVLWYVDGLGISPERAGLVMLTVGVFLIINELVLLPRIEKVLGDARTLALGLGCVVIGLGTLSIPSTLLFYLVPAFILNLGLALVMPTIQAVITRSADAREEGEVQGISTSVAALASTAAPVLAGVLYAAIGGDAFLLFAAVAAVGLLAFVRQLPALDKGQARTPSHHHGPVAALAERFGIGHRVFGLSHKRGVHTAHAMEPIPSNPSTEI